jgi:hypothetical protein
MTSTNQRAAKNEYDSISSALWLVISQFTFPPGPQFPSGRAAMIGKPRSAILNSISI